jgi:hypothetical protein
MIPTQILIRLQVNQVPILLVLGLVLAQRARLVLRSVVPLVAQSVLSLALSLVQLAVA